MLDYNFQLIYKKGGEMPANYLSRIVVSAISLSNSEMEDLQDRNERLQMIRRFLISQELPEDPTFLDQVKRAADDCFMEDRLIWKRVRRQNRPNLTVLYLPRKLIPQVLANAHGAMLS